MKFLILTVIALAAVAQAAIDRSKIKPVFRTVTPRIPAIAPKIVGGEQAEPGGIPFQVALLIDGGYFCGGSIIKKQTVLTAAHCVDSAGYTDAIVGAHYVFEDEPTQQIIRSSKIVVHEDWNPFTLDYDIALVHLSTPIELGARASTVNLNQDTTIPKDDQEAIVSGWGRYSDDSGGLSDHLRYGKSKIISNQKCAESFGSYITGKHVCLDGTKGVGSCNGDSGGPLTVAHKDQPLQIGIVSFGSGAGCQKGYPTAYTRCASFKDWIAKNSGN